MKARYLKCSEIAIVEKVNHIRFDDKIEPTKQNTKSIYTFLKFHGIRETW